MEKILKSIEIVLSLVCLLTGCVKNNDSVQSTNDITSNSEPEVSSNSEPEVSPNSEPEVSPNNQRRFKDQEEINTLQDVIKLGEKSGSPMPSIGNPHIFVVPVEFKDYPAEEIGKYYNGSIEKRYCKRFENSTASGRGAAEAISDIEKTFFGNSEDTQWESLSSYYYKSSYGKLNLDGIVVPWYRPVSDNTNPSETWMTAKQWATNTNYAVHLVREIIDYYSNETDKNYLHITKIDGTVFASGQDFLQYFDSDSDGFFDYISIVYSAPFYATDAANGIYDTPIDNDLFWNYCGNASMQSDSNIDFPTVNKYSFFSYYSFVEAGKMVSDDNDNAYVNWTTNEISDGVAKMDAHMLIHESGHALGLPDYYDYDYKKNPAGSVDMMDQNIGDHNSYSKTQLGWVDPIVVTGPTEVNVRSFTDTGDCIMVPYRRFYRDHPLYGNSTMIEYLAIELYTPTGVNKTDSEYSYAGIFQKCPSIPGIKIYHVDSRLGLLNWNTNTGWWKLVNFTEEIVQTDEYSCVAIATSNTGSRRIEDFWRLQFLPRSFETKNAVVNNGNLFQKGDTFNSDKNYTDFMMNERNKDNIKMSFGYKITIEECSSDGAKILFEAC